MLTLEFKPSIKVPLLHQFKLQTIWITFSGKMDFIVDFMSKGKGEGNGNSLQYSCLENPMDGGSLEGCSPWGCWGSDMTEQLHFHFSLSYIGEGNGNPLQCSCLENLRDGGAWWVAVCGVTQSQTRLTRLSSMLRIKYRLKHLAQVLCEHLVTGN